MIVWTIEIKMIKRDRNRSVPHFAQDFFYTIERTTPPSTRTDAPANGSRACHNLRSAVEPDLHSRIAPKLDRCMTRAGRFSFHPVRHESAEAYSMNMQSP